LPIRVQYGEDVIEFPDGTSDDEIKRAIDDSYKGHTPLGDGKFRSPSGLTRAWIPDIPEGKTETGQDFVERTRQATKAANPAAVEGSRMDSDREYWDPLKQKKVSSLGTVREFLDDFQSEVQADFDAGLAAVKNRLAVTTPVLSLKAGAPTAEEYKEQKIRQMGGKRPQPGAPAPEKRGLPGLGEPLSVDDALGITPGQRANIDAYKAKKDQEFAAIPGDKMPKMVGGFVGDLLDPIYALQPELKAASITAKLATPVAKFMARQGINVPMDIVWGSVSHAMSTGELPSDPEALTVEAVTAFVARNAFGAAGAAGAKLRNTKAVAQQVVQNQTVIKARTLPGKWLTHMPEFLGELGAVGQEGRERLLGTFSTYERMHMSAQGWLETQTEKWGDKDHELAAKLQDGALDPAQAQALRASRPDIANTVDAWAMYLKTLSDEMVRLGALTIDPKQIDPATGKGKKVPYRPLGRPEYLRHYLQPESAPIFSKIRDAGSANQRRRAGDEGDIIYHFGDVNLRYADNVHQHIAELRHFGNDLDATLNDFRNRANAAGEDGDAVRDALARSLGEGENVSETTKSVLRNVRNAVLSNTLWFSAPTQVLQAASAYVKSGDFMGIVKNALDWTASDYANRPEIAAAIKEGAVGFGDISRSYQFDFRTRHHDPEFIPASAKPNAASRALAKVANIPTSMIGTVDLWTRHVTAPQGVAYAKGLTEVIQGRSTPALAPLLDKLGLNASAKAKEYAEKELREMGFDLADLAKRNYQIDQQDYAKILWWYARETNYGPRQHDTPLAFSKSAYGHAAYLLNRFAGAQLSFFRNAVLKPLRHGEPRPLLRWLAVTPITGAAQAKMMDFVYNREPDDKELWKRIPEFYAAGAMGILYTYGRSLGYAQDKVKGMVDRGEFDIGAALDAASGASRVFGGMMVGTMLDVVKIPVNYGKAALNGNAMKALRSEWDGKGPVTRQLSRSNVLGKAIAGNADRFDEEPEED
jgi:hypothetical protein